MVRLCGLSAIPMPGIEGDFAGLSCKCGSLFHIRFLLPGLGSVKQAGCQNTNFDGKLSEQGTFSGFNSGVQLL
jgi:hypothetical protein